MNIYYVAAIWLGMAFLASAVSIKIAIPAALVETLAGQRSTRYRRAGTVSTGQCV